jgi:uncharacterized protein YaaW (UPF0174 family)
MAYRKDDDLEFLQYCSNEELGLLVEHLTLTQGGEPRIGESLTRRPLYRKYYPDHQKYWRNIAEEIQVYGANTVATFFRGNTGVLYRDIVIDVAKKYKCSFMEGVDVAEIEKAILLTMLTTSIDEMSTEELEQLVDQLNLDSATMSKGAIKQALLSGWNVGSTALVSITAGVIAKAVAVRFGITSLAVVGGGAATVGSAALGVLTGPVGIAALAGSALAGPAYRVTIPCVVQIAFLRLQHESKSTVSRPPQKTSGLKALFSHG